jgi:hypothetical protein
MSREFNRYVDKQFTLRMKSFNLEPTKASGVIAWPGERCFRTLGGGTVCWICVFPDYKGRNEFNIELAWSHHGEYPASQTSRPTVLAIPPVCFSLLAEGFVRLGNLAKPPRDGWGPATIETQLATLTATQAASVAGPLVDDEIHVIEVVGLPLIAQANLARSAFLENVA